MKAFFALIALSLAVAACGPATTTCNGYGCHVTQPCYGNGCYSTQPCYWDACHGHTVSLYPPSDVSNGAEHH